MVDFLKDPEGFGPAREFLARKVRWPTELGSADISLQEPGRIRAQAFFSAKVASAEVLAKLAELTADFSAGRTDQATARLALKTFLADQGYGWLEPDEAGAGDVGTLVSTARLDLILDQNAAMAHAVATREVSERPEVLEFLPNYRYVANTSRHGEFDGAIIPKTHPWWDTHTPPIDFRCGCAVEDTFEEVNAKGRALMGSGPHQAKSGFQFFSNPRDLKTAPDLGTIADPTLRDLFAKEWAERAA